MNPRDLILQAAARLLTEGGREAVSTRAVSRAAGVQAPTIYRQFGDMQGLLDAVASHDYATYLASKCERETLQDPVEDLRRGWNLHIDFGLSNPALYSLMYGPPPGYAASRCCRVTGCPPRAGAADRRGRSPVCQRRARGGHDSRCRSRCRPRTARARRCES